MLGLELPPRYKVTRRSSWWGWQDWRRARDGYCRERAHRGWSGRCLALGSLRLRVVFSLVARGEDELARGGGGRAHRWRLRGVAAEEQRCMTVER
jgi:hypothetical protein